MLYPNVSCCQFVQTLGSRTMETIVYLIRVIDKQFKKDLELLRD